MPVAASTDAADRIPGAWVDMVEGAGHFVWVEAPGAVRASLRRLTAVRPVNEQDRTSASDRSAR
jgi:pimeloyl-ACP methyl ester carboxylesterase